MASPNLPPLSDDSRRELETVLERLTKAYQASLETLADEAADAVEYAHGRADADLTGIMRDYARDASQQADDYYNAVRKAYENAYGHTLEDYATSGVYDPDRTLYRMVGGFNGGDWNGLNYTQLKNGQSRAGLTVDDLWPSLANMDDAMQWAADMVRASARYTMERDLADDPTGPRWARVTGGAKPCAFCVMLAGRGFVYHSKETATLGGSFHDGKCHCTAIPGWKNDVLTPGQQECKAMYEASVKKTGGSTDENKITVAMNHLFPDKVSGGVYDLSAPWPDDVRNISDRIWTHILEGDPNGKGGHAPWSKNPGKTKFPDAWDEKKIKWAIKEVIVSPDEEREGRPNTKELLKTIEGVLIRVRMNRRKNGWPDNTAFPDVEDKRGVNT